MTSDKTWFAVIDRTYNEMDSYHPTEKEAAAELDHMKKVDGMTGSYRIAKVRVDEESWSFTEAA